MKLKTLVKAVALTAGAAVLGKTCFSVGAGAAGNRIGKALNNMEESKETEEDKELLKVTMDLNKKIEKLKSK